MSNQAAPCCRSPDGLLSRAGLAGGLRPEQLTLSQASMVRWEPFACETPAGSKVGCIGPCRIEVDARGDRLQVAREVSGNHFPGQAKQHDFIRHSSSASSGSSCSLLSSRGLETYLCCLCSHVVLFAMGFCGPADHQTREEGKARLGLTCFHKQMWLNTVLYCTVLHRYCKPVWGNGGQGTPQLFGSLGHFAPWAMARPGWTMAGWAGLLWGCKRKVEVCAAAHETCHRFPSHHIEIPIPILVPTHFLPPDTTSVYLEGHLQEFAIAGPIPSPSCTDWHATMTRLSVYGVSLAVFIAGT